jgi:membrane-associated phospholipid phosphatase
MSVVIMGHLCMSAEYTLTFLIMVPISLGVVAIVGASRIYARSRFPHQIAGSWVLGFIGLIFWSYVCEYMAFHKYVFLFIPLSDISVCRMSYDTVCRVLKI